MKRFWIALSALIIAGAVLPASPALGASLVADYRLNDSFTSSVPGAPALGLTGSGAVGFADANVAGANDRVLTFVAGAGLVFKPSAGLVDASDYTVMFTYEHDALSGYQRLIQFETDVADSDDGLYSFDDELDYYDSSHSGSEFESPTGVLQPNVYADLTMTRAASGAVSVYLGNAPEVAFTDALGSSVIDSDGLRFFKDNGNSSTEQEAGSVARIRVFDGALTPAQIATVRTEGGFRATATTTGKLQLIPTKPKKAKKVSPGVTVSCPSEGVACPTKIVISSVKARAASAGGKVPGVLGTKTVAVAPGTTVAMPPVKLTRRARKAIKAKGKIKAQASVSITPYSGRAVAATNDGRL